VDPAKAADLGWIEPPKLATVVLRDAENPLDAKSLQVILNGQPTAAPGVVKTVFAADRKSVTVEVNLEQAFAADRFQVQRHTLVVTVADQAVIRHETRVTLSYIGKVPQDPTAVYLSDLKPAKAFAHGGPNYDRNYRGEVAAIGDRVYPKCVMLCPGLSPDGTHGEIVYELPANAPRVLHSDIGIENMARPSGSVVFTVQRGANAAGPWETLFTSPVMRGGMAVQTIKVELGEAKFLRLFTTDAGDGHNSDHALWGNLRLVARP
jgi:hypothetical protein